MLSYFTANFGITKHLEKLWKSILGVILIIFQLYAQQIILQQNLIKQFETEY